MILIMPGAVRAGLAGVLAGALSVGCGSPSKAGQRVSVVASFYPLAEVARRVGGDGVAVRNLTPPGAEPHDIELTANQVATIEDADVVLVLGHRFQPAVEKAARRNRHTIEVLERLAVTGTDPHVWLDPQLMAGIVDITRDALSAADAANATTYHANATRYRAAITALDDEYRAGLATCARHEIVTAHEAFGRLASRYGLVQRNIAGISPESEPDPHQLAALSDRVRRDGVTTIFTEALVSPKIARTLARETGVKTQVLDPIEGLSKRALRRGTTYVSVMQTNLAKLRAALGCS